MVKTLIVAALVLAMPTPVAAKTVTATAYHYAKETASGKKARCGTVAVSQDLARKEIPMGSIIHVDGLGALEVCDVMHRRKCQAIDVFIPDRQRAKDFGVQRKEIKVLRHGQEKQPSAMCPPRNHAIQKR